MNLSALRAAAVAVASCSIGAQGSPQGTTAETSPFSSPKPTGSGVGALSQADHIQLQITPGSTIEFGTSALRSWTGGGGSNASYDNPSNWSPNGVPTSIDTLLINLSPDAVTPSVSDLTSASYQLFVGGTVNLDFGSTATPPSLLRYTAYTAPSLIIGNEDGPSVLNLISGSTLGASVVDAEWMQVGGESADAVSLSIGANTQLNTGRLFAESAVEATLDVFGTLYTGYDNAEGGSAPDGDTYLYNNTTLNIADGGSWKAFDNVTMVDSSLAISSGGSALLHRSLNLDSSSVQIQTPRILVGDTLNGEGLSVLKALSLRPGSTFSGLKSFEVAPEGRVILSNYEGSALDIPVTEYAKFDGTLELHFGHGFNPAVGSVLPLLTTDALNGRFDVHLLPGFEDDRVASIVYGALSGGPPNTLSLSVSLIETVTNLIESPPTFVDGIPVAGTLGDLDGDMLPDLALVLPDANPQQPGSILILINNGDPDQDGQWNGFGPTIQVTVGRNPRSVAIGDFDPASPGLDFAVANAGDNTVAIYSNIIGDATDFELSASIPVGSNPLSLVAGAFNMDDKDDLAVACAGSNEIYFLTNTTSSSMGSVNFAADVQPVDTVPIDIIPGDWDEDKDLDLAAATAGGQTVILFKNDGNSSFTQIASYPTGSSPRSIASGSLDNDADHEIIVANDSDGTVGIYRNDSSEPGELNFTVAGSLHVGDSAYAAAIVDIDGDGLNDIAVVTTNPNTGLREVNILHNSTTGANASFTFSTSTQYGGTNTVSLLTGDVNGDGRKDLLSIDDHSANFEAALAPGQKLSPGSVNVLINASGVRPTCPGDTNADGVVNAADLSVLLGNFGHVFPALSGPNLNSDGIVNGADLSILLSQFGGQCKQ